LETNEYNEYLRNWIDEHCGRATAAWNLLNPTKQVEIPAWSLEKRNGRLLELSGRKKMIVDLQDAPNGSSNGINATEGAELVALFQWDLLERHLRQDPNKILVNKEAPNYSVWLQT
jgi:hypothetical protein